ncbi:hypothetical protein Hlac_3342 (plasmid) [Halorubrum lacusprofundi ATCC 49239]|uniref:Uncharacterized protein n=1 Tax=Halorubrum lacusprofundi (strain ATCC 49239 / DSM 5036 / JCM 8891 / ACAM 34) TaxID=416348 RepID=B9LWM2_HALLT|nr:hypothetical protein Hlac_3342 [Halorubrum lacusprofundi ATCC 49239]
MLCEVLRLDYFVSDLIPVFVNKCSVNNTKMIISPLINLVLDSMPSVTRMQKPIPSASSEASGKYLSAKRNGVKQQI